MVRKKLDERVRTLIERGVVKNERSILVLVGDHGKDQVPNIYQLMTKMSVRARPEVLWCYKKELGFSTHRMKRIKKIKRDKARGVAKGKTGTDTSMDNFELFLTQTVINWCYYRDTHRVLGTTVGMLVLQDFEALTPNLMARTIETVEGGGLVIFLMRTVKSLKQLYAMSMDVHSRYRTESAGDVTPRFNERFILSLGNCANCLVCDDELNVLPLSKASLRKLGNETSIRKGDTGEVLTHKSQEDTELEDLKASLRDTPHVGVIVDLARTMDQARAVLSFLEACSEKTTKSTVALTAGRGRGKSAAIGLCLAGALSFGYSTIIVTAPEPENVVAVFDFVIRGLNALRYQEHMDYTISYHAEKTGREQIKCIVGIEVHKGHRQSIRYIKPDETDKFASAELVAIDEAAAIPLPTVKALMGDYLTFMSSTINGYEGTGRALSLKLIKELRDTKGRVGITQSANEAASAIAGPRQKKGEAKVHEERWAAAAAAATKASSTNRAGSGTLLEIELSTPIRYASNDPVESWLNELLCLDCGSTTRMKLVGGAPAPSDCELYHVHRDALFSYHQLSEAFLQKMMGLYTSAHYKNSPNDLQLLSDAPAHSVFVLLSPSAEEDSNSLPDILAVVQVALEGRISRKAVEAQLARGHRSAGDMIPWTISQQFGDSNFAQLSGARIVRVAVHPSVQGMGYGSRAVELLYRFYNGEIVSLSSGGDGSVTEEDSDSDDRSQQSESDTEVKESTTGILSEKLLPRKQLPPLLLPLAEVEAPRLDWIGTSFGMTFKLHRFWKRSGMRLLYTRQTKNELTGEHSAIMVRALPKRTGFDDAWLPAFLADVQRRTVSLLGGPFRTMDVRLAIAILEEFEASPATGKFATNEIINTAIGKRSGSSSSQISAEELNYFLTPHDLKRIEQYGRNLCDHHLVSDLLPTLARLCFTGRFGENFKLSSLQGALLCGVGLQQKTIDHLKSELGLPQNQMLAMFNKSVRKISINLHSIMEESERAALLSDKVRLEAEKKMSTMNDVSLLTLQEDAEQSAKDAMAKLQDASVTEHHSNVTADPGLMEYAIKGTDSQWDEALKNKDSIKTVQIKNNNAKSKRKLTQEDIDREITGARNETKTHRSKKKKKSSSKAKG